MTPSPWQTCVFCRESNFAGGWYCHAGHPALRPDSPPCGPSTVCPFYAPPQRSWTTARLAEVFGIPQREVTERIARLGIAAAMIGGRWYSCPAAVREAARSRIRFAIATLKSAGVYRARLLASLAENLAQHGDADDEKAVPA